MSFTTVSKNGQYSLGKLFKPLPLAIGTGVGIAATKLLETKPQQAPDEFVPSGKSGKKEDQAE